MSSTIDSINLINLQGKELSKNSFTAAPSNLIPAKTDTIEISSKKPFYKDKKTIAVASGTFVTGALIAALVLKGKCSKLKNIADEATRNLGEKIDNAVKSAVKPYLDESLSYKTKLNAIIDAKTSQEIDEKLLEITKKEIHDYKLDYDPTNPLKHFIPEEKHYSFFTLTEFKPTSNRANMKELYIPEFKKGQSWQFELPETSQMKPVHESKIEFRPIKDAETNISLEYANSVQWSNDKIGRDILQNFYDGHGQTLDGVKLTVKALPNGKYNVRIDGKGIYTPDKAILLGETSKRDIAEAAGNYGEGLKMTVLKILKDSGAKEVVTGADSWKVTFKIGESKLANKKVLTYSLDSTNHYPGNYFEFETDKPELVESIKKTINRFYHSSNTDFKCPDFENSQFGIKYLDGSQKGGIYIAGQKFEYEGSWDGVESATVFFKNKPPVSAKISKYSSEEENIFDPSRDRTSLNAGNLEKVAKYFASNEKTSEQELVYAIQALEKLWTKVEGKNTGGVALLNGILEGASERYLHIKFPDEYLALPSWGDVSQSTIQDLRNSGYKICNKNFGPLGMTTVDDYLKNGKNHISFVPTETDIKKIGIIRKAVQQFRPYLENECLFSGTELNPEIFIFDGKSIKEAKTYRDTLAEAIIKIDPDTSSRKSVGFWIDRDYLSKASFSDVISTALHEITHKAGGDVSAEFSYKLTDVLEKVIKSGLEDKHANIELSNLRKIWDELVPAQGN